MATIAKGDQSVVTLVFALVFTEFFVFRDERLLLLRIEFARNMLRLFVNEIQPM
jgi:hypothetical protein